MIGKVNVSSREPLIIGFTGTQVGMSEKQKKTVRGILKKNKPDEIHQGCCIGADEDFVRIIRGLKLTDCPIISYPSNIAEKTSQYALEESDMEVEPMLPLTRNKLIVADINCLLACPKEKEEQLRSGTWATVRYARKAGVRIIIVFPDGSMKEESAKERTGLNL